MLLDIRLAAKQQRAEKQAAAKEERKMQQRQKRAQAKQAKQEAMQAKQEAKQAKQVKQVKQEKGKASGRGRKRKPAGEATPHLLALAAAAESTPISSNAQVAAAAAACIARAAVASAADLLRQNAQGAVDEAKAKAARDARAGLSHSSAKLVPLRSEEERPGKRRRTAKVIQSM